ncbi:MAG: alpha/beta fold hydrolase BchO [Pseudomonadota bacterium]
MLMPTTSLSWPSHARAWPHHTHSRFVEAAGFRWHVQEMAPKTRDAPCLLLLHGSGASTHSWRDMMPGLAEQFRVIAIDLPGHAFTEQPPVYRPTLQRVSALIAELLLVLGITPDLVVGHSAGAAIAVKMALDHRLRPKAIVSFNGAFQPFDGVAGTLFPALAKLLVVNPFTPRLFSFTGRNRRRIVRLIEGTGSTISDEGLTYYQTLVSSPGHVAGVLSMMAHWDLEQLMRDIRALDVPLHLIVGENDRAVPADVSAEVADGVAVATLERWAGLGHLAHEEAPEKANEAILAVARTAGLIGE